MNISDPIPTTGVIILPTQTMHCYFREILQNCHRFVLFDSPKMGTLPETNIAPENGWLEYYFPFGNAYFQVLC